jgi:hypothetical protein
VKVEASEVVFVGYGLVAPEDGRDDYKGVDVRGKTVLMLATDPGPWKCREKCAPTPAVPGGSYATRALSLARKREEAVSKGAAARILVHEKGDPLGPPLELRLEPRGARGRAPAPCTTSR